MSINKSVLGVNIKLNHRLSALPVNTNYDRVCNLVTLRSVKDISLIFEANKDFYYRKALESIGNNGDYYHYKLADGTADPRCNCILCWTFRKAFNQYEYPSNYAKMLCCVDQLQNDNIFPGMKMIDFVKITESYNIPKNAIPYLWTMIFGNKAPKGNQVKSRSLRTLVGGIMEDVDMAKLIDYEGVHTSKFPKKLKTKINVLQKKYDDEFELTSQLNKIRRLSRRELVFKHIRRLEQAITYQSRQALVSAKHTHSGLSEFWKHKFMHDHLVTWIRKARIKDANEYAYFKDLTRAKDKERRLQNRLAIMGSKIAAVEKGLYLISLNRAPVQKAYEDFNAEFSIFLTDTERKNFRTLFKLTGMKVVPTTLSKNFLISKNGIFYLELLTQTAKALLKEHSASDWWYDLMSKSLQSNRQDQYIWENSRETKIDTSDAVKRIDVNEAVREYVRSVSNISSDSNNISAKQDTYAKQLSHLVARKESDYIENYIAESMMYVYHDLKEDLKQYVNQKWAEYEVKCRKNFMSTFNIETTLYDSSTSTTDGMLAHLTGVIEHTDFNENWNFYWKFKEKKKNIFLWTFARTLNQYDLGVNPPEKSKPTKKSMEINALAYERRLDAMAQTAYSELELKASVELNMNYLIFNSPFVNPSKLDGFLYNSMPPTTKDMFVRFVEASKIARENSSFNYMENVLRPKIEGYPVYGPRTLEETQDDLMKINKNMIPLLRQIDFQREVFKDIVYEKEILKRSILRNMKQNGGFRSVFLTPETRSERLKWLKYKYQHRRQWVMNEYYVYVHLEYNKYGEDLKLGGEQSNKRKALSQDNGGEAKIDARMKRLLAAAGEVVAEAAADNNWRSSGRTSGIHKAWVVSTLDTVQVNIVTEIFLFNKSQNKSVRIKSVEVPYSDIYDNIPDYDEISKEISNETELERKRKEEAAIQRDLMLSRRKMLIGLSNAELEEEKREDSQMQYIEEINKLMYSEEKAQDRLDLFLTWKSLLQQATAMGKTAELEKLLGQCTKAPHLFVMYKDGRDQWLEYTGIGGMLAHSRFNSLNRNPKRPMRTLKQQIEFDLTNELIEKYKTTPQRVESNLFTRRYFRYIFLYSKNKEQNLVKTEIIDLMRGITGPERTTFMNTFRQKWLDAVRRQDVARKEKYEQWIRRDKYVSFNNKRLFGDAIISFGKNPEESISPEILSAQNHVLETIDKIIAQINGDDENSLLQDEEDEAIRKYIQTEMDDDVITQLKTPKLRYNKVTWELEVDKSLAKLTDDVFLTLREYVEQTEERKFNVRIDRRGWEEKSVEETEYQREFIYFNENTPVYPVPSSENLLIESAAFDPRRGKTAAPVRVAYGRNSWFEINQSADIMRITGLSLSERLQMAEDISSMEHDESVNQSVVFNDRYTALRKRIRAVEDNIKLNTKATGIEKIKWKPSDGDGSLRIVDDCVGTFSFDYETLKQVRTSARDIPTHVRLNFVYFDGIRGRDEKSKAIRKLVPFYVVSLYRATPGMYTRARVRNRASATFLPRQRKYKDYKNPSRSRKQKITPRYYAKEDYKGYKFSLCLSEKEFVELTNKEQLEGPRTRAKTQIPDAFLHEYHKQLYEKAKSEMETKLIRKKKGLASVMQGLTIGDSDDDRAPLSDGLIQLGDVGGPISYHDGVFSINNAHFKTDGDIATEPKYKYKIIHADTSMYHNLVNGVVKLEDFDPIIQVAIKSDIKIACVFEKNWVKTIKVCTYASRQWDKKLIDIKVTNNTMLRWCGDTLLIVSGNVVQCFNDNCENTHTLEGHTGNINTICVKDVNTANVIVTGSDDNSLIAWVGGTPTIRIGARVLADVNNKFRFGKVLSIEQGTICEVILFATPNKKRNKGTFNCKASAYLKSMYSHTDSVMGVTWGNHIVSSSRDNTVRIWRGEEPGNLFELLHTLDFTALGLPAQVNSSTYDELFERGNKSMQLSQAHLLHSGGAVHITSVPGTSEVLYCFGMVLGKLNTVTGTRIPFADDIVNIVSGVITSSGVFDVRVAVAVVKANMRLVFNELHARGRGVLRWRQSESDSEEEEEEIVPVLWFEKQARFRKRQRRKKRKRFAAKAERKGMTIQQYRSFMRNKAIAQRKQYEADIREISVEEYERSQQLRDLEEPTEGKVEEDDEGDDEDDWNWLEDWMMSFDSDSSDDY